MDELVKQAMAKWPNVPHCYGWLGLSARGNWYMRDDAAQAAGLKTLHLIRDGQASTKAHPYINDFSQFILEQLV